MSIDAGKLTGAPMPVTIGDDTYQMSPMTDKMHATLNNYVRQRHIRQAIESVQGLDQPVIDRTILVASRDAHSIEWTDQVGLMMLNDVEGTAYLVFVCTRKTHPKLMLEEIETSLTTGDVKKNQREVARVYKELNTVDTKNSQAPAE